VEATAADRSTAALLGVRPGAPLLLLTSLNVDATGEPFEHFTAWYRADRTSFRIDVGPTTQPPHSRGPR
jgi:DNA-binding GntR family transcriptional regulator